MPALLDRFRCAGISFEAIGEGKLHLGIAIRGIGYGELEITAARCDPCRFLTLLDAHDQPQTVH